MTRREVATWLLLFATIATAVCTGIVVAALILGTLSPVSASRSSQLADSPSPSGEMTTERPRAAVAGQAARTERPEPVALRASVVPVRRPAPSPSVGSHPAPSHQAVGLTEPPAGSSPATAHAARSEAATISGLATWYCGHGSRCTTGHPDGMYAAVRRDLLWLRGHRVTVCAGECVEVTVIDCNCGPNANLIDLYSSAFEELAPLSRGVVAVTVTWREP